MLSSISSKQKNQIWFIIFSFISFAVMVLIFIMSSQVAEESAELSSGAADIITKITETITEIILPDAEVTEDVGFLLFINTYLRKIAHFTIYTVLGAFLFSAALNIENGAVYKKILISMAIGLLYSVTDEFHQLFVEGRSGEITDVLIDFGGVVLGTVFVLMIYKIFVCVKKKNLKKI